MKKVIISQPMRGKSEEQIREERAKLVRELTENGYEVVDTVFPDFFEGGNIPVKYLAKSIEAIADVDCVYFMDGWDNARGCRIEFQVCLCYGIEIFMSEMYAMYASVFSPHVIWKNNVKPFKKIKK
jgi:hypothetical protein